jgi:hypothetical protein
VNILVLSKHKTDTTTQFIDASALFKKETNNNVLLDSHIEQIMAVFDSKANVDHFAQSVPLRRSPPTTTTCRSAAMSKPKTTAKWWTLPSSMPS